MAATLPCVAVVDDDASVLKALRRLLTASGFEAHAYGSGQEFLDSPDSSTAGCALLDIRMPGLDGFAVAKLLLTQSVSVPFIFMSAHGDGENRRRAEELGAVAFLKKPASEKKIVAAIRLALGSPEASADQDSEVGPKSNGQSPTQK